MGAGFWAFMALLVGLPLLCMAIAYAAAERDNWTLARLVSARHACKSGSRDIVRIVMRYPWSGRKVRDVYSGTCSDGLFWLDTGARVNSALAKMIRRRLEAVQVQEAIDPTGGRK